jgi:hypothetical protein
MRTPTEEFTEHEKNGCEEFETPWAIANIFQCFWSSFTCSLREGTCFLRGTVIVVSHTHSGLLYFTGARRGGERGRGGRAPTAAEPRHRAAQGTPMPHPSARVPRARRLPGDYHLLSRHGTCRPERPFRRPSWVGASAVRKCGIYSNLRRDVGLELGWQMHVVRVGVRVRFRETMHTLSVVPSVTLP